LSVRPSPRNPLRDPPARTRRFLDGLSDRTDGPWCCCAATMRETIERGGNVIEHGGKVVDARCHRVGAGTEQDSAAFASRLARFLCRPFVSCAALMCGSTAFAGDLAPTFLVHRCKSALLLGHFDAPSGRTLPARHTPRPPAGRHNRSAPFTRALKGSSFGWRDRMSIWLAVLTTVTRNIASGQTNSRARSTARRIRVLSHASGRRSCVRVNPELRGRANASGVVPRAPHASPELRHSAPSGNVQRYKIRRCTARPYGLYIAAFGSPR